jgi:hypothetical protein
MNSYADNAARARAVAIRFGFADCIHYASNWQSRIDALYAEANALGLDWHRDPVVGSLADGRLAIVWGTGGLAEDIDASARWTLDRVYDLTSGVHERATVVPA